MRQAPVWQATRDRIGADAQRFAMYASKGADEEGTCHAPCALRVSLGDDGAVVVWRTGGACERPCDHPAMLAGGGQMMARQELSWGTLVLALHVSGDG